MQIDPSTNIDKCTSLLFRPCQALDQRKVPPIDMSDHVRNSEDRMSQCSIVFGGRRVTKSVQLRLVDFVHFFWQIRLCAACMADLEEKMLHAGDRDLYRIATEIVTLIDERIRKEADMTDIYIDRMAGRVSRMTGSLRSRWVLWRKFQKLVLELRTKSDDELRDAGLDPIARRLMARRAIYGN